MGPHSCEQLEVALHDPEPPLQFGVAGLEPFVVGCRVRGRGFLREQLWARGRWLDRLVWGGWVGSGARLHHLRRRFGCGEGQIWGTRQQCGWGWALVGEGTAR